MKRIFALFVFLLTVGNLMAADRYIVVLDKKPVIKVGKMALKTKAAKMYKQEVLEQQKDFINFVENKLKGKALGSIQTVLNAVFIKIDPKKVEKIKEFPGVKSIQKDKIYTLKLDGANRVCNNVAIYRKLGMSNLDIGKGMKIAILDTGIDISNPMFNDEGFTYPEGFNPGDDNESNLTNNKVIVAKNFGNDQNASDQYGHGTACAGCAAGRYVEIQDGAFLYKLLGAAPGAYLGNYKVFTMGPNGPSAYQSSILNGIDAAVNDGMDVISMSLGGDIGNTSSNNDAEDQAIENAVNAGVVVTVAAGNEGDNSEDLLNKYGTDCSNGHDCYLNHLDEYSLVPMSIGTPGNTPDAITVGAVDNERDYESIKHSTFYVDGQPIDGLTDIKYGVDTQVAQNLTEFPMTEVVDLADYTADDKACNSLSGVDLSGKVVLVKRGDCYFCQKIKHCQDAGAAGVIVYNNKAANEDGGGILNMDVGPNANCPYALSIPGFFISKEDGQALKQVLASSTDPVYFSISVENEYVKIGAGYKTWFSSTGPTKVDYHLKPDVAAPGQRIMAPTQDDNSNSDMYSATGFGETQGTSFSTPYTAGIVAAFKSLYPDLTPAEIKGIVCTATSFGYDLYQSKNGVNNVFYTNGYAIPPFLGGGIINMEDAVNAKLALIPSNISFGNVDTASNSKNGKGSLSRVFEVKNVSDKTISFIPSLLNICANSKVNASISPTTKQTLQPGQSVNITLTANYTDPAATHLMGFVVLTDNYGNEYKLPYYGRFVSSDVLNHGDIEDEDGDGVNHGTELGAWSDVYVKDTDNDGMSDGDEINGINVNGKTVHYNPANATSVYYDPFEDTEFTYENYVPIFSNDYDANEFDKCYLYVANPHDEAVDIKVLPISPSGNITTTIRKITLQPNGWAGIKIDKKMYPIGIGWILVKSTNTVQTVVNFEEVDFNRKKPGKEANYYIEQSAAIAGTNTLYSKVYVPHIAEQTNQWQTFVSIANPGDSTISASIKVPGASAVNLGSLDKLNSLPIEDIYSDVFNSNFPYDPSDKAHWWATIQSNGGQFAAMESFSQLRFDDESDPTPLMEQVGALLLTDETSKTIIIPHVDTSWLWWTGIVINNTADTDATITMTPYDADGNALTPVTFTLGANSKAVNLVQGFWTSNNAEYPDSTAWIKITSDQPITGYELFGIDPTKGNNNKGQDALAGVRPIMHPTTSIAFPYVFTKTSSEWCGIVVINANDQTANLTVDAYNALGEKVGEVTETLSANQKWVGVVDSNLIPGLTDDVKWIKVTSDVPVGGFALFGDLDRYYMSGYKAVDLQ